MLEQLFPILQLFMIFLFGVYLSAAFSGIIFNRKNIIILSLLTFCMVMAMVLFQSMPTQTFGWYVMPLIGHLPNLLLLVLYYHKRVSTSLSAICTSFLLCQPPKWIFSLLEPLFGDLIVLRIIFFIILISVFFIFGLFLSQPISEIFNKDTRNVYIFGSIPIIYYIVNYFLEIQTNHWTDTNPIITEFYRFLLCFVYLLFCTIYYKEYEQKADLERKEQIIRITIEQQQKEMDNIRRTEQELRILRHDMRLFLNTILLHIEEDNKEGAYRLATTLIKTIDKTTLHRFCNNDTLNYILSDFNEKCKKEHIRFNTNMNLDTLPIDDIVFSSILSNGLDNAFNAVLSLPDVSREIHLLLKFDNEHLLLSIRNPYHEKPIFSDGLPISTKRGHGYGTQSIRYMSERLGGNCMFSIEKQTFLLRVILPIHS